MKPSLVWALPEPYHRARRRLGHEQPALSLLDFQIRDSIHFVLQRRILGRVVVDALIMRRTQPGLGRHDRIAQGPGAGTGRPETVQFARDSRRTALESRTYRTLPK